MKLRELSRFLASVFGRQCATWEIWQFRALYIFVEDDVAEAIVTELLRRHDADFGKTVRCIIAGDTNRIQAMMDVFQDQRFPVCAVRDGDIGPNKELKCLPCLATKRLEKEIFKSATFRGSFIPPTTWILMLWILEVEAFQIITSGLTCWKHIWPGSVLKYSPSPLPPILTACRKMTG